MGLQLVINDLFFQFEAALSEPVPIYDATPLTEEASNLSLYNSY